MEYFLAVDTITVPFSVAIGNGESVLAEEINFDRTALAGSITIMVDRCCRRARLSLTDLKGVVLARGPGSYTGLRIGYSVAKGLCMALGLPLIEADPLEALVRHIGCESTSGASDTLFCAALDARRNEVYLEIFDRDFHQLLEPGACILPCELKDLTGVQGRKDLLCAGDGAGKLVGQLGEHDYRVVEAENRASYLLQLIESSQWKKTYEEIAEAEPFYLKPPNITTPRDRHI